MERIKLGDAVVPVSSIDLFWIDQADASRLCIHTKGNYQLNVKWDDKEECRENFDMVLKAIDNHKE